MRKIIFRGKRVDNGEWVEGQYVHRTKFYGNPDDTHFILTGGEFDCDYYDEFKVDSKTVGQYTGLKDKNGVKIFSGDIVRYGDTVHEVVFEQRNGTAYFGLVYSPIETLPFGHYQDLKQIEVIGNAFDNSELLRCEQNDTTSAN